MMTKDFLREQNKLAFLGRNVLFLHMIALIFCLFVNILMNWIAIGVRVWPHMVA